MMQERTGNLDVDRLVARVMNFVDRHLDHVTTRAPDGSGYGGRWLWVPILPNEMKELRAALEPFRRTNALRPADGEFVETGKGAENVKRKQWWVLPW